MEQATTKASYRRKGERMKTVKPYIRLSEGVRNKYYVTTRGEIFNKMTH